MGAYVIDQHLEVRAPIAFVFERLVDHEAMSAWPGLSACLLVREGTPRNGLGAIRELHTYGMVLQEEVVQYEPPHRYDYRIIRGLPVQHRGTVTLAEDGPGVKLHWHIEFSSKWPGVAGGAGRALDAGMPRALAFFKADAERRFAQSQVKP